MPAETDSDSKLKMKVTPLSGVEVEGPSREHKPIYYICGVLLAVVVAFGVLAVLAAAPALLLTFIGLLCVGVIISPYFESISVTVVNGEQNTPVAQALAGSTILLILYVFETYSEHMIVQPLINFANTYDVHISIAVMAWVSVVTVISKYR